MNVADNPLAAQSDSQLVFNAFASGATQGAFAVEMMRRLKDSLERHEKASADLGNKIWWLNFLLLVFTIAIFVPTSILAWATLRAIAR